MQDGGSSIHFVSYLIFDLYEKAMDFTRVLDFIGLQIRHVEGAATLVSLWQYSKP